MKRSNKCPECRSPIEVVKVNHQINSLIEQYLLSHGHLGRSEDERAEMDRSDDISKVVAGGGSFKPENHDLQQLLGDSDEFDEDEEEDDFEEELDDFEGERDFEEDDFEDEFDDFEGEGDFEEDGFEDEFYEDEFDALVDRFTAMTAANSPTATRVLVGALHRGLGLLNAVSYYFQQIEAGNFV